MLVAIGLPLAATSASAAVGPTHIVNAFPVTDIVIAEGYAAASTHPITILRGGLTVGSSSGVANAGGLIEVNHPPTGGPLNCFIGVTPDLRPGDVIQVDGPTGDTTTVAGVTVTQPGPTTYSAVGTGTVTVHGTAPGLAGAPRIPVDALELRINAHQPKFAASGAPNIRAAAAVGEQGTIAYDDGPTGTGTAWTATFPNMNTPTADTTDGTRTDGQLATASGSDYIGMWIVPGLINELTHFEMALPIDAPLVGGPLAECAAVAPAAKDPTSPRMTAATDTGGSTTDGITKNTSPSFSGFVGLTTSSSVDLIVDNAVRGRTTTLTNGAYVLTPATPLAEGTHVIKARETGALGIVTESLVSSAKIDLTAPKMLSTSPASNATGAPMASNVTATFDDAMALPVGGATFTLKNATTGVSQGGSRAFGLTNKVIGINLNATSPLALNTRYTAALTTGITDAAGNLLVVGAPQTWSFTTATSVVGSYVNRVYSDLFNRKPDAGGLSTWTFALTHGTARVAVANSITSSTEYRQGLITGSYQKYLGRTPDVGGLNANLTAMSKGMTISVMESGFIGSNEYYIKAGNDDSLWVNKLYTDVLGRTAATAEVNSWTAHLRTDMSRSQVAIGFLLSAERLGTVVDGYYQKLLGRNLDPTGRAFWVGKLQAGVHNETIIGNIIASTEYYAKN